MVGTQWAVQETLEDPDEVRKSSKDPNTVRLYYRRYTNTLVGDKFICVAVKFLSKDAFILTAYIARRAMLRRANMAEIVLNISYIKEAEKKRTC
jgi:hypothetical protein